MYKNVFSHQTSYFRHMLWHTRTQKQCIHLDQVERCRVSRIQWQLNFAPHVLHIASSMRVCVVGRGRRSAAATLALNYNQKSVCCVSCVVRFYIVKLIPHIHSTLCVIDPTHTINHSQLAVRELARHRKICTKDHLRKTNKLKIAQAVALCVISL